MWIERKSQHVLTRMAGSFPAVLVTGPRQTGKTSLLRHAFPDASYVSLDLPSTAEAAQTAPDLLLSQHPCPVIIDEVQYAPSLLRVLKHRIDSERVAGQYLLTGSQLFPLMQGVSESLAGRCGIINLNTLSFAELGAAGVSDSETEYVFTGGYPELSLGADHDLWFPSYVATYLERDVRNILNVVDLRDFNRFLRVCALRTGQTVNYSDLARDTGIAPNTARKWLGLLEASGIVLLLEPYFGNRTKRVIKSPRLIFLDTGLAAFLAGFQQSADLFSSTHAGAFWESYVIGQVWRHFAFRGTPVPLCFWRTTSGAEVDLVLERNGGRLTLVECKLSGNPGPDDAGHLRMLAEAEGERVADRYIASRTPASYQLRDGTWVVPVSELLNRLG
jgi:predicted AAA+ superfamily ATPase